MPKPCGRHNGRGRWASVSVSINWTSKTDAMVRTNTPMSLIAYMPGAEPYWHSGADTGCLVLHGFTASPAEVRWLSEYLAGQGHTVYAPRLAGHGTTPESLARTRWQDWYAAALDGYWMLRATCQRVVVVGHSMGGLLALLLASDQPVAGVAALAAPIRFSGQTRHARWIYRVRPYTDQTDRTGFPERLRQAQLARGEAPTGRVRYDRWPTRAVAELVTLSDVTRDRLEQVSAPLLLVNSAADPTVPADHAGMIAAAVASADVERHMLHTCQHILTQDVEHETVFALVAAFVARLP